MQRRLLKLALTATLGSLLASTPIVAQLVPPAPKAERVEITRGPVLELAKDNLVIIRWTTNNPGGTPGHFAVVYYGTDPKDLSQMAKSPMQLNRAHPETIFRVRVVGVKPQTTYYYKVSSTESNGRSDGVASAINQFTTPAPGERIVNFPQPK